MNPDFDLVIRSAGVSTPGGIQSADIAVSEGRIVQVSKDIRGQGRREIDAKGLVAIPGIIDAHVHFNDPGRSEWEGLDSGSLALAAGGGTLFFDMPLNSLPPTIDGAAFAEKRRIAEHKSHVDFALWGGLVPGNLEKLGELKEAGAIGLKAFMCGSGVSEFPGVTDAKTLREGMKRAAALGMIVGVHAENDVIASRLTAAARSLGRKDIRSWLDTRPVSVELEAISTALECAGETGCKLHIVHVSSPEGLALIDRAKQRGADVTAETCPHYLLLNEASVLAQGAPAKCCPPLRTEAQRTQMWEMLRQGSVDTVGSDHSPAPPSMKTSADFFDVWGGVSGCQHGFPLFLSEAIAAWGLEPALVRTASLLGSNVVNRFAIPGKGRIEAGFDADITLIEVGEPRPLSNSKLLYRHVQGPYDGRLSRVRVVHTLVRGGSIIALEAPVSRSPLGRFIQPLT